MKSASLAVAILVTALVGAPAFATEQAPGGVDDVTAFAKPSQKPRPSHPHATPVPTPAPEPTRRVTPRPDRTQGPDPTPRTTERPRSGEATPKPTKRPSKSARESAAPSPTFRDDGGGMEAPSGGTTSRVGPSPELIGLAPVLAAVVGIGFLWIVTRRRRRRPVPPGPVMARVAAVPPLEERWTTASLDDNDALPDWLRALSEPERAPLAAGEPGLAPDPALGHQPPPTYEPPAEPEATFATASPFTDIPAVPTEHAWPDSEPLPARPAATFSEPLAGGAIRLAVGSPRTELLDQPGDSGVALSTLIAGDEIEIKDIQEPWIRVVTPVGTTGWLRSSALGFGDPPADDPATDGLVSDHPGSVETEPNDTPKPPRRGCACYVAQDPPDRRPDCRNRVVPRGTSFLVRRPSLTLRGHTVRGRRAGDWRSLA